MQRETATKGCERAADSREPTAPTVERISAEAAGGEERWKGNQGNGMVVRSPQQPGIVGVREAEEMLRDFKGLLVWKKAHALALNVYRVTSSEPGRANSGLVGQSRRAAISIAANIAEGCGRDTQRDFAKFLNIAFGSATELEYHMILARDLGLIGRAEFRTLAEQIEEVRRMLTGLVQRVRAAQPAPSVSARGSRGCRRPS